MYQYINDGSVTSVKGFKAAGIFCGIKKKRKDIALIYSELPCTVAGTFTLNKVKAAPLLISQEVISKNKTVKAVLINSGNANACTGDEGHNDALITQQACAKNLGIKSDEVLIASTGVIGQRMPMETMLNGIKDIVPFLNCKGGLDAAEAILTTDKKIKSFAVEVTLKNSVINIGAICKGSGMIAPNMATMLGFITTDAQIENGTLQELLSGAVSNTFNKISVDGETSTNDMVLILANGSSGSIINKTTDESDYVVFQSALNSICKEMAKSIVSDGEGATKLVTISIKNARTTAEADMVGKSIANSALVKTAMHGADANWGRILSAVGQSGADIEPSKISISFSGPDRNGKTEIVPVLLPNYNLALDETAASKILSQSEFTINVDLGLGKESTTWWTCDFSEEYVTINADYRS